MHRGGFLRIFLIIAVVTLLLDWYVYYGLKTFVKDWTSVRLKQGVLLGYLLVSVGVTILFLAGIASFSTARGMTPYHEWMLSLFITFFITKLVFALILLIGDLGRLFYGIGDYAINRNRKPGEPFFPARRKFISEIAILVAAVPFSGFLYGMLKGKYDYKDRKSTRLNSSHGY